METMLLFLPLQKYCIVFVFSWNNKLYFQRKILSIYKMPLMIQHNVITKSIINHLYSHESFQTDRLSYRKRFTKSSNLNGGVAVETRSKCEIEK
ncbi:hypothetical protein QTP88_008661 [Uroleucon formosanum]